MSIFILINIYIINIISFFIIIFYIQNFFLKIPFNKSLKIIKHKSIFMVNKFISK